MLEKCSNDCSNILILQNLKKYLFLLILFLFDHHKIMQTINVFLVSAGFLVRWIFSQDFVETAKIYCAENFPFPFFRELQRENLHKQDDFENLILFMLFLTSIKDFTSNPISSLLTKKKGDDMKALLTYNESWWRLPQE